MRPENIYKQAISNFDDLNKQFLQENLTNHQRYSEIINKNSLWENFIFNEKLGSIEFSHHGRGYALALNKESVLQALAMKKLNGNLSIYSKVLPDGSIKIHLSSVEYNLSVPCYSIKSI